MTSEWFPEAVCTEQCEAAIRVDSVRAYSSIKGTTQHGPFSVNFFTRQQIYHRVDKGNDQLWL